MIFDFEGESDSPRVRIGTWEMYELGRVMRKAISYLGSMAFVTSMIFFAGCDMGTYETRAGQPVPEGAMIAGEVPAKAAETQEENEAE